MEALMKNIKQDIKNGKMKKVYLVYGEEELLQLNKANEKTPRRRNFLFIFYLRNTFNFYFKWQGITIVK